MSIVYAMLFILLLGSSSHAQRGETVLLCPYDVEEGISRELTLNREAIRVPLQQILGSQPWKGPDGYPHELEVAGETRYAPNRGLLTLDMSSLSQPLIDLIFAPLPDGAGCTEVTDIRAAKKQTRSPRVEDGTLVFDAEDTRNRLVSPDAFREQSSSLFNPMRYLFSPSSAWAQSGSPVTPPIEQCNCTEDPLDGCTTNNTWGTIQIDGGANSWQANGTICHGSGTTVSDSIYRTDISFADVEIYATMVDDVTGNLALGVRIQQPGAGTQDGYVCDNPSLNTYRVRSIVDGALTTIGANVTVSEDVGDSVLCSVVGSFIYLGYNENNAGWALLASRDGSGTITGVGSISIGNTSTSGHVDNIGGGQAGRRIWLVQ